MLYQCAAPLALITSTCLAVNLNAPGPQPLVAGKPLEAQLKIRGNQTGKVHFPSVLTWTLRGKLVPPGHLPAVYNPNVYREWHSHIHNMFINNYIGILQNADKGFHHEIGVEI